MKKSKEFIVEQLNNMVSLFPFLKVKYEFEPIGMCHYIEVLPATAYNSNQEYIKFELSLEDNFGSFYKDEDVCFLTEGSLYEITDPIYENEGICYGENTDTYVPEIFEGFTLKFPTQVSFFGATKNVNLSSKGFEKISRSQQTNTNYGYSNDNPESYNQAA